MTGPELSIVMPVFKEGEAVEPAIRAIARDIATPHEILVVYDFDEDPTVPVIARLAAELPQRPGPPQRPGSGRAQCDEGGHRRGRAGTTCSSRWPTARTSRPSSTGWSGWLGTAPTSSRRRATCAGADRSGDRSLKRIMSRTAGLTLHWFAGVATHDPTNNFKLYARRFLDAVVIESTAGFELALELTVKATLDRPDGGRGADDLAGPDGRPEQLPASQVAAPLPALVPARIRRAIAPAGATSRQMIERLRLALERIGLPAWFVVIDLLWIAKPDALGIDARHYQNAATTWLAGGDPWSVTESGIPYAAGPHTLLFYAPTSVLPVTVSTWLWLVAGAVAAVWLVRQLELPLVVARLPAAAAWRLERQPADDRARPARPGQPRRRGRGGRSQALCRDPAGRRGGGTWSSPVAVLAVVTLVLPWQLYLDRGLGVGSHLQTAWNGSAWRFPILVVPTLVGAVGPAPAGRRVVRGPGGLPRDAVLLRGDGAAGPRRSTDRRGAPRPADGPDGAARRDGPRRHPGPRSRPAADASAGAGRPR